MLTKDLSKEIQILGGVPQVLPLNRGSNQKKATNDGLWPPFLIIESFSTIEANLFAKNTHSYFEIFLLDKNEKIKINNKHIL